LKGGLRAGAGRKCTGRQHVKFYITAEEKDYLKHCLIEFRGKKSKENTEFENIIELRGQQRLKL
jgi:hypothetical protein